VWGCLGHSLHGGDKTLPGNNSSQGAQAAERAFILVKIQLLFLGSFEANQAQALTLAWASPKQK